MWYKMAIIRRTKLNFYNPFWENLVRHYQENQSEFLQSVLRKLSSQWKVKFYTSKKFKDQWEKPWHLGTLSIFHPLSKWPGPAH